MIDEWFRNYTVSTFKTVVQQSIGKMDRCKQQEIGLAQKATYHALTTAAATNAL